MDVSENSSLARARLVYSHLHDQRVFFCVSLPRLLPLLFLFTHPFLFHLKGSSYNTIRHSSHIK